MGNFLIDNYKGKYRLKAEIDKSTWQFVKCRSKKGKLVNSTNDVYIDCRKGRIYYYGSSVLEVYIPKKNVARNVIKSLVSADLVKRHTTAQVNQKTGSLIESVDYDVLYKEISESTEYPIYDLYENDKEFTCKIKAEDLDWIKDEIGIRTTGADISPFSVKNLPKIKHEIPADDEEKYKNITSELGLECGRLIKSANAKYVKRLNKLLQTDIKNDAKNSSMKLKDYIHFLGKEQWDDYIEFLKKEIKQWQ